MVEKLELEFLSAGSIALDQRSIEHTFSAVLCNSRDWVMCREYDIFNGHSDTDSVWRSY